jgi:hypothetical protein
MARSQELLGDPRDEHVVCLHHDRLLPFFPGLNERRRSTRRTRDLWMVILVVRVSVHIVLEALQWKRP